MSPIAEGLAPILIGSAEFLRALLLAWKLYNEQKQVTPEEAKKIFDEVFPEFMEASANPIDPVRE